MRISSGARRVPVPLGYDEVVRIVDVVCWLSSDRGIVSLQATAGAHPIPFHVQCLAARAKVRRLTGWVIGAGR